MNKFFNLILFLILTLFLVSCDISNNNSTTKDDLTKLSDPVLMIDNKTLLWEEIVGAEYYEVYVGNKLHEKIEVCEYDLSFLTVGTHILKVRACSSKSNSMPSNYSAIKYTYELKVKSDEYTVFMINDTHGAFNTSDTPGLAKVETIINGIEESKGEIIKVANGDIFQGSYVSNVLYGRPIIDALNQMDFSAFVLGNHDFDWGLDMIKKYYDGDLLNGEAEFPVLGANIYDKKTNQRVDWIDPYTIIEQNGNKIGIIGLIGYNLENSILAENVADYDFVYPVELVSEYAKELREELECDSVIVSIHDYDENLNQNLAELSGSSKIDAILCGHTHQSISTSISSNGYKIPVVQNRDKNQTATSITIDLNTFEYITKTYFPGNYTEDGYVMQIVEKYQKQINEGNRVIGTTSSYLNRGTLGKMAVDCMADKFEADIAIVNTGGIRSTIDQGDITISEVFEVFPFNNEVILLELDGYSIKTLYNKNGEFLYFNSSFDISIISNNDIYLIAVIDYVFSGAYYDEFKNVEFVDTDILMRDILIEHIENNY